MKLLKNILVTFLTAVTTVILVYGGYTIYAAEDYRIKVNFRDANDFFTAFNGYHGEMNQYMNGKIEKLNLLVKDNDFYQNPEKKKNFLPPPNIIDKDSIAKVLEKCGEDNVSTYCVSIGALDKYLSYLKKLDELKNSLDFSGRALSKTEIAGSYKKNREKIDRESEEAKMVMEGAIHTYNEYRLAYPMHRKYEKIIIQLNKYRLALKDIRKRAALFPERFIDATTTQCE